MHHHLLRRLNYGMRLFPGFYYLKTRFSCCYIDCYMEHFNRCIIIILILENCCLVVRTKIYMFLWLYLSTYCRVNIIYPPMFNIRRNRIPMAYFSHTFYSSRNSTSPINTKKEASHFLYYYVPHQTYVS